MSHLKKGYQLLALGIDASYLWNAAKVSFEAVTLDEDSLVPAN
jgi:hypothetical protein